MALLLSLSYVSFSGNSTWTALHVDGAPRLIALRRASSNARLCKADIPLAVSGVLSDCLMKAPNFAEGLSFDYGVVIGNYNFTWRLLLQPPGYRFPGVFHPC